MNQTESLLSPWLWTLHYDSTAIPSPEPLTAGQGANCQRFAYAIVEMYGVRVPPHRSSDLWADKRFEHPNLSDLRPADLVLFNDSTAAYGAHLAVVLDRDRLLHLCQEVGIPTVWSWSDFAVRERYACVVGAVRAGP